MNDELLQSKLQICTLLAQVGQLQVQNASLLREKLQREAQDAQAAAAQKAHDAAVDARAMPSGAV
jgi:hypothetical protein